MDRSTSKHLGKVVEVVVKQKHLIPVKPVCTTGMHMATGNECLTLPTRNILLDLLTIPLHVLQK
jgi:hypothetical protein